jgi:hypothetical protein
MKSAGIFAKLKGLLAHPTSPLLVRAAMTGMGTARVKTA